MDGGDVVGKGLSEANDDDDDNTTVWWHLREETDIQIEIEILKQDFTLCLRGVRVWRREGAGRAADVTDVKEETYVREEERGGTDRDREKTPFKHC